MNKLDFMWQYVRWARSQYSIAVELWFMHFGGAFIDGSRFHFLFLFLFILQLVRSNSLYIISYTINIYFILFFPAVFPHVWEKMNISGQLKPVSTEAKRIHFDVFETRAVFAVKQYYSYWPINVPNDAQSINYYCISVLCDFFFF